MPDAKWYANWVRMLPAESAPEKMRNLEAADMIESLAAELEKTKHERDVAIKDIRKAAFCGCHVCEYYYRPDPNVRKYACRKYGNFDEHDFIADDGSIFCGAMKYRGVKVGEEANDGLPSNQ